MKASSDRHLGPKLQFLIFALWTVFLVFTVRLFYLQILQGGYYHTLSENNYTRSVVLRSPRGKLLDRNGKIVCRNRISFSLVYDTDRGVSIGDTLAAIKRILGVTMTRAQVEEALHRSAVPHVAVLARDVPVSWLQKVEAHQIELKGLHMEMELRRNYPYGDLASHAIGYVGLLSPDEAKDMRLKDVDPFIEVGKTGVEKTANRLLMGTSGRRISQVNSLGREVDDPRLRLPGVGVVREPVPGRNIQLTIDMTLQTILEKAFGNETGSAIFMNPNTGQILAWVSLPNFDPNVISNTMTPAQWHKIADDPRHPLLDRPIQGAYPPGSTFKPFVALVGLEEGAINEKTTFFCPGYWKFGGHVFHCWKRGGHGAVNILTAIQNSCNVFFYHVGDLVGIDALAKWGRIFGLGQKTGVDLPGELSGILPSPEWKKSRGLGPWYPGETLPIAIGQGYLTVTPLQLLSFYATLATGGRRYQPLLIDRPPRLLSSVDISPRDLDIVKEGLWQVVNKAGTGTACRIPGLDVCAKTGTAQVVKASAGVNTYDLKKDERDHAWFAGFAPRKDPSVVFVVMVEHGGHGGNICAPIAKAGLEYLFYGKLPEGMTPEGKPKKEGGAESIPPQLQAGFSSGPGQSAPDGTRERKP